MCHNISWITQAVPYRNIIICIYRARLANSILKIEVWLLGRAVDAYYAIEVRFWCWAIRDLRVCCLIVIVINSPLVQRSSIENKRWRSRRVCLHFLRSCAAIDIWIKNCRCDTASTLRTIIRVNRLWARTLYTLFSCKIWHLGWARAWVKILRCCIYIFENIGRRTTNRSPKFIVRIWIKQNRLTVKGYTIVYLIWWTCLTIFCNSWKKLIFRALDTTRSIKKRCIVRTRKSVRLITCTFQAIFVILNSLIRR